MLNLNAVTIHSSQHIICQQLTLQINSGEIWGVLGCNGSGKTTLLHSLANLHPLFEGDILFTQQKLTAYSSRQLAKKIGLLLQDTAITFPATVYDTLLLGRYPQQNNWNHTTLLDHEIVQQALNDFDLTALKNNCITKISGGERQRVSLALIAVQQPEIYLLDELTNHLDIRYQLQALDYFTQLNKTIVMSLHDINLAKKFCSHILLLNQGKCLHGPVTEILTEENLAQALQQKFRLINNKFFVPNF